jgi:hypothetical protein
LTARWQTQHNNNRKGESLRVRLTAIDE